MRFFFFSISSLSFFPVFKYILDVFLNLKQLNNNSYHLVESHLKGFPDYGNVVNTHYYYKFNSINHFNSMSFVIKIKRYVWTLFYLIKAFFFKNTIVYTCDYQVLFIIFKLKKIVNHLNFILIYHQYELIDFDKKKIVYQNFKKHASIIDLAIFPEINRLNYFVNEINFNPSKTLLFPNTCITNNENVTKHKILSNFNQDDIIIAHIGNIGFNHFFTEIIDAFLKFNLPDNYKLIFIGKQSLELQKYIQHNTFKNIYFFQEVPHNELSSIYNYIDCGLILYKPIDLNFDYCAPNKLYEYWAHGVPVISHNLKGLEGLIKDEFGYTTDFNYITKELFLQINKLSDKKREFIKQKFIEKFDVHNYQKILELKLKELLF